MSGIYRSMLTLSPLNKLINKYIYIYVNGKEGELDNLRNPILINKHVIIIYFYNMPLNQSAPHKFVF